MVCDKDQGTLIEASLHGTIVLLAEDTGAVEGVRTSIWSPRATQNDIGRVVCYGEVESKIFLSLSVVPVNATHRCIIGPSWQSCNMHMNVLTGILTLWRSITICPCLLPFDGASLLQFGGRLELL